MIAVGIQWNKLIHQYNTSSNIVGEAEVSDHVFFFIAPQIIINIGFGTSGSYFHPQFFAFVSHGIVIEKRNDFVADI